MKLRIKRITLKNFKTFEEITIHPNPDFNIIIGENSVGKSTVFEALHLWEKCYQTYILASKKSFYKVKKSTNRYVSYQDLDFLRITKDEDLFYNSKKVGGRCSEITVTLTNREAEGQVWDLGFKVTCPTSIKNAFYRIQPIDEEHFTSFATEFCKTGKNLDEAIFLYQTRPVSGVHQFEPYYNEAQIKRKIKKGFSHEVLRNKIISKGRGDSPIIVNLENSISEIIEKKVRFKLPPQSKRRTEEFVDLTVSIDGSEFHDLHLEGSGFLQITEILSTIEYVEAPLKLLLVDEPDSHIHSKIQQNLIKHLRSIDHNQFFVISHNEQFVTNSGDKEVFYLSEETKKSKKLDPLPQESFDNIKKALGGVILSLEHLNQAKNIVFVEGKDDAVYLEALIEKITSISDYKSNFPVFKFFPLRGKDKILRKLEYNKRTLSELFAEKRWLAIFDRDFSTLAVDKKLKEDIERVLKKDSLAFSHNGYCIESVIFSDVTILKRLLTKTSECDDPKILNDAIDEYVADIKECINRVGEEIYDSLRASYDGQRKNRDEFKNLDFDQIIREWCQNGSVEIQNIMNKEQINRFVQEIENKTDITLFQREGYDKEDVSSQMFMECVQVMENINDVPDSFLELLKKGGFIERRI